MGEVIQFPGREQHDSNAETQQETTETFPNRERQLQELANIREYRENLTTKEALRSAGVSRDAVSAPERDAEQDAQTSEWLIPPDLSNCTYDDLPFNQEWNARKVQLEEIALYAENAMNHELSLREKSALNNIASLESFAVFLNRTVLVEVNEDNDPELEAEFLKELEGVRQDKLALLKKEAPESVLALLKTVDRILAESWQNPDWIKERDERLEQAREKAHSFYATPRETLDRIKKLDKVSIVGNQDHSISLSKKRAIQEVEEMIREGRLDTLFFTGVTNSRSGKHNSVLRAVVSAHRNLNAGIQREETVAMREFVREKTKQALARQQINVV